jgi:hypothetical protein
MSVPEISLGRGGIAALSEKTVTDPGYRAAVTAALIRSALGRNKSERSTGGDPVKKNKTAIERGPSGRGPSFSKRRP